MPDHDLSFPARPRADRSPRQHTQYEREIVRLVAENNPRKLADEILRLRSANLHCEIVLQGWRDYANCAREAPNFTELVDRTIEIVGERRGA